MSTAVVEALYGRYNLAAIETGATLLLDEDPAPLAAAAAELLADSRAALAHADAAVASQLEACTRASAELYTLLERAVADSGSIGVADTQRVRASHSDQRREVWKVIPGRSFHASTCRARRCIGTATDTSDRSSDGGLFDLDRRVRACR
jgi:hypothetical protein